MFEPFAAAKACRESEESGAQQQEVSSLTVARLKLEGAILALAAALIEKQVSWDREDAFACLNLMTTAWNDLRGLDQ